MGGLVVGPTVGQVNVPALLLTMYLPLFVWHLVRSNLLTIFAEFPEPVLHPTFMFFTSLILLESIAQLAVP